MELKEHKLTSILMLKFKVQLVQHPINREEVEKIDKLEEILTELKVIAIALCEGNDLNIDDLREGVRNDN